MRTGRLFVLPIWFMCPTAPLMPTWDPELRCEILRAISGSGSWADFVFSGPQNRSGTGPLQPWNLLKTGDLVIQLCFEPQLLAGGGGHLFLCRNLRYFDTRFNRRIQKVHVPVHLLA